MNIKQHSIDPHLPEHWHVGSYYDSKMAGLGSISGPSTGIINGMNPLTVIYDEGIDKDIIQNSMSATETLGSGVLRSGGKTAYIAVLDSIGTWCIGVPLGILSAFYLNLPIWWVYFLLSLEECFRLAAGLFIFKSRRWMGQL